MAPAKTPLLGCGVVGSISPVVAGQSVAPTETSVLDSSLDMSLDTSTMQPTPMANAEHQLLRGGEETKGVRAPVIPFKRFTMNKAGNKENAVNESQAGATMFDTPAPIVLSRKKGLQRRTV